MQWMSQIYYDLVEETSKLEILGIIQHSITINIDILI